MSSSFSRLIRSLIRAKWSHDDIVRLLAGCYPRVVLEEIDRQQQSLRTTAIDGFQAAIVDLQADITDAQDDLATAIRDTRESLKADFQDLRQYLLDQDAKITAIREGTHED